MGWERENAMRKALQLGGERKEKREEEPMVEFFHQATPGINFVPGSTEPRNDHHISSFF